jgi:hypothetical protein
MRRFEKPIVLGLFACWSVGFGAVIWKASQHSPANYNSSRSSETKEQTRPPLPNKGASVQTQTNPADSESRKYEKTALETFFELKLTDVLLVVFTAILAWRTSGLFVETAGLRDAADRQRTDSLRSIAATEIAAKASQQSAETSKKALFAAYQAILTITEFELRDPNARLNKPHIHWGIRNAGPGMAIVQKIGIKITVTEKTRPRRIESVMKKAWVSAIEARETASGHVITTPTIISRVNDIRSGNIILYIVFEVEGQDVFKDPLFARFPFVYDSGDGCFRLIAMNEVGGKTQGTADTEQQETSNV